MLIRIIKYNTYQYVTRNIKEGIEVMVDVAAETKSVLAASLQLGDEVNSFVESTPLLGSLPELDSMAVVTLITAIEDHFGILVDDDEITADTFESLGSLIAFVKAKL